MSIHSDLTDPGSYGIFTGQLVPTQSWPLLHVAQDARQVNRSLPRAILIMILKPHAGITLQAISGMSHLKSLFVIFQVSKLKAIPI